MISKIQGNLILGEQKMSTNNHYDLIIIGTGAGGGTLAYRIAQTGKRILILERGSFLPREKANWDTKTVFNSDRYHNSEVWYDKDGNELHPGMSYFVGGNTKVYGAALFRLREKDFEAYQQKDGISPEWALKYRDFEPYYVQAEKLYQVHGKSGIYTPPSVTNREFKKLKSYCKEKDCIPTTLR
jgi:choline dehydrogenase-like flavoprotein